MGFLPKLDLVVFRVEISAMLRAEMMQACGVRCVGRVRRRIAVGDVVACM
jgi:hypothetical protein